MAAGERRGTFLPVRFGTFGVWGQPTFRLALVAAIALAIVPTTDARAEETAPPSEDAPVPDDATLEARGAVVGAITIRAGDIFDPDRPGENNLLFRTANKLHRATREGVIRRQLLFESGDRFRARELAESERILRSNGYFYDAKIRPVRYDGQRVDIEVQTRDVWTLHAGVGGGRAGGSNSVHFGLRDKNFFGTGKDVTLQRSSDVDRTEMLYSYTDPALAGTRGRMRILYSDNSDGQEQMFRIERPFFALSSTWALGLEAHVNDRVESIYGSGDVTSRLTHERRVFEVFGGRSRGVVEGRTNRLLYGFTYEHDRLRPYLGPTSPEQPLLEERVLSYPWIGFESLRDGFVTTHDLDKIRRTEDLNLGREIRARLGVSSSAFGGDRTRVVYDASFSQGLNPANAQMLFLCASLNGRVADGASENVMASASARYYLRSPQGHVFFAALRGDAAQNLDPGVQLMLGGDSGLRGYPLRFREGDRRILVSLEERFYGRRDWFKLLHVGAAVFFDAGRAWFSGDDTAYRQPYLQDVGFGLRLSSSRSSRGGMVKLDVSFPLQRLPGIPRFQFTVTAGDTF